MSVTPDLLGAEIFAAVTPANNGKLSKDLTRMSGRPEQHRYVIFLSPRSPSTARHHRLERNGVEVWSVAAPRW